MVVITFYFHPEGAIMEATESNTGSRTLRALTGKTTSRVGKLLRTLCESTYAFSGKGGLAPAPVIPRKRKRK